MNNITPLPTNSDNSKGIRDEFGRWLRGPGRKLGSKNKQSAELMKTVRAMGPRAVERLAAALDQDEQWAIQLVLKYCLPAARTIEMEGAEPDDVKAAFIAGDLSADETKSIDLSADETKSIATAMEKLKGIQDLDDLRERLSQLEKLLVQQTR